jgi:hypothetical protein
METEQKLQPLAIAIRGLLNIITQTATELTWIDATNTVFESLRSLGDEYALIIHCENCSVETLGAGNFGNWSSRHAEHNVEKVLIIRKDVINS